MKRAMLVAFLLLWPVAATSQESDGPKPDRWRGLVIDEATPEDAIKALGAPDTDKTDRIRVFDMDSKWISKKQEQKIFRKLQFKKLDGFDKAELDFLDGKLAMIELDFDKEIPAAALSRIYGIQFTPKVSGFTEAMSPGDFERNQGKVYPKIYPSVYYLVAVTERVFVGSMIANNSFGSLMRQSVGARDTGDFPGKSARIQTLRRHQ